tara:strand:+ start:672 stop:1715 length:1044 start_codon:yes stop_codon:yes gene_type:complete
MATKDDKEQIPNNTMSKSVEYEGYYTSDPKAQRETLRQMKKDHPGIGGLFMPEPEPKFIETKSEKVFKGKNNSYIVMGKDRPGNIFSGYGGIGHTQANMIDMVVGRMGFLAKSHFENGDKAYCDNNFTYDAARVYISQKTKIDTNFGLESSFGAPTPMHDGEETPRAAIGMKADLVRIIGRENIRIVTGFGVGEESGLDRGKRNSLGGRVMDAGGIDLIANNNTNPKGVDLSADVQPLVKGHNLQECLINLYDEIMALNSNFSEFVINQSKFNTYVINHTHDSPFFLAPTKPSLQLETVGKGINTTISAHFQGKIKLQQGKMILNRKSFTDPLLGDKYICSYKNHTN